MGGKEERKMASGEGRGRRGEESIKSRRVKGDPMREIKEIEEERKRVREGVGHSTSSGRW